MNCIIPGRNNLDETSFVPIKEIVKNIYKTINPSFKGINSQSSSNIWPNKYNWPQGIRNEPVFNHRKAR